MKSIFPKPITSLPEADVPLEGVKAYLSQASSHQIIFMEFENDVEVADHIHESQWAVVLEGRIDLVIDGVLHTYRKGDHYFIPANVRHSAKIHAGYADVTYFNQESRYKAKASK
ncbi:MAG: cupin domain-containing protein [Bacteroidota bacterium]